MGRRRMGRPAAGLAVLLLAVVALTGCKQDNTPSEYNDITKANFIAGCTQIDPNSGDTISDRNGAPAGVCNCAYDWFTENVPYNTTAKNADPKFANYGGKTFVELNIQLKNSPDAFPSEITAALTAACPGFGTTSPSAGTGGPTTSAATTSSSTAQ